MLVISNIRKKLMLVAMVIRLFRNKLLWGIVVLLIAAVSFFHWNIIHEAWDSLNFVKLDILNILNGLEPPKILVETTLTSNGVCEPGTCLFNQTFSIKRNLTCKLSSVELFMPIYYYY